MKILRHNTLINWDDPREDYARIYQMREDNLKTIRRKPGAIPALLSYYADGHWAEFISDWGMTYDPREAEVDLKHRPFILYPRQVDLVRWIYGRYIGREKGLLEKFRGAGFTWLAAAIASILWLAAPMSVTGFGSRKKELVDNGFSDPDSILWKVRQYIDELPAIFLPDNYDSGRKWGVVPNLANGAIIKGEIGDEIGRGGRAQPLTAPVLTPYGWRPIGTLSVGDELIHPFGGRSEVIAVHPQGVKQIYRISFSDGTFTECTADHLWRVTTPAIRKSLRRVAAAKDNARSGRHKKSKDFLVMSTERLSQHLFKQRTDGHEAVYQIPLVRELDFPDQSLPLSPYVVGVLLGDGNVSHLEKTAPAFTVEDQEIAFEVQKELPEGWIVNKRAGLTYTITAPFLGEGNRKKSPVKDAIVLSGIAGKTSWDKRIPQQYLMSSKEARISLLQGLIDTDGWITQRGKSCKVNFSSVSKGLAEDVKQLVQSLGGVASVTRRNGGVREFPEGRVCHCLDSYSVILSLPIGIVPARLPRKVANFVERSKYLPTRCIVGIRPVREEEARCITIDRADGLYVTNDFIVTHNSSLYIVDEYAHLEHQELAEAALSENADCVVFGSTVNGSGNNFYRLRHHLPDEQIFIFDWTEDPRKRRDESIAPEEEPWYKKKKAENTPTVFASQYLRQYDASVANSFFPADLFEAAFARSKVSILEPAANWRISVDASGMGNDKTIIWRRRGRLNLAPLVFEKLDGVQIAAIVEREAKQLLKSAPLELISIEQDGPGQSTADQLRYGPFASVVASVHTGTKLGDGHNYNLRAFLHSQAKEYLEEAAPVIPKDEIFKAQATALQYSYKGGLLLLESKDDYRARFSGGKTRVEKLSGKSPDRSDAFVLSFVPPRGKPIDKLREVQKSKTSLWRPLDRVMGY